MTKEEWSTKSNEEKNALKAEWKAIDKRASIAQIGAKKSAGNIIQAFAAILTLLGVLVSILIISSASDIGRLAWEIGGIVLLASLVLGALMYGVGEICITLSEINAKLK